MDERGDDLSGAIADFSLDEIIAGFELVATKWHDGVELLKLALSGLRNEHSVAEIANAEVCGGVFRSTWNLFRFYKLRLDWDKTKLAVYKKISKDELENLNQVLPYVENDKRFGYHSEAHDYMFNAEMIKKKIAVLGQLDF
jgi:hypothetical protein